MFTVYYYQLIFFLSIIPILLLLLMSIQYVHIYTGTSWHVRKVVNWSRKLSWYGMVVNKIKKRKSKKNINLIFLHWMILFKKVILFFSSISSSILFLYVHFINFYLISFQIRMWWSWCFLLKLFDSFQALRTQKYLFKKT